MNQIPIVFQIGESQHMKVLQAVPRKGDAVVLLCKMWNVQSVIHDADQFQIIVKLTSDEGTPIVKYPAIEMLACFISNIKQDDFAKIKNKYDAFVLTHLDAELEEFNNTVAKLTEEQIVDCLQESNNLLTGMEDMFLDQLYAILGDV